jgi:hypothetical protein
MRSINRLLLLGSDTRLTPSELRRLVSAGIPRHPKYGGVLAEAMPIQIGQLLKDRKPDWYPGSEASWRSDVEAIRQRENLAWRARELALADHYGIRLDGEPSPGNRWHELALALAQAHVPGFRFELAEKAPKTRPKGAAPMMSDNQIVCFAAFVCRSLKAGRSRDSQIVKDVLETNQKEKLLMFGKSSSKKNWRAKQPIGRQTAGRLLRQLRDAWCAVQKGEANAFQYCVVSLALQTGDRPNWKELWSAVLFRS